MRSDYPAILDACVLLPMPLADTLLRMAETPRLYIPRWSEETMGEVTRNMVERFGKTPEQAQRREAVMREHFPEAFVDGYQSIVPSMTNDPGDRHVLAAAVKSATGLIVTYNHRHFPKAALAPFGIECQGPSSFLISLYDLDEGIVVRKLTEQAQNLGLSLERLLSTLKVNVPLFVQFFCEEQRIDLPAFN